MTTLAVASLPRTSTSVAERVLVWFLGAYIVGRMFMVFGSGLPQPADMSLVVILALYLRPPQVLWLARHFRPYVLFVGWVLVVNGVWALLRFKGQYAMHMAYYCYNLSILALVGYARFRYRESFDRVVGLGILVGAVIQSGLAFLDGQVFRVQGTFNNPNQLAIWSLCLASTYLVVRKPNQLVRDGVVLGLLTFCEFITTSRAGVVAFLVVALTWLYEVSFRSRYRYVVLGSVMTLGVLAPTIPAVVDYLGDLEVVARLDARFNKEDSFEEVGFRNTDRITRYYYYALLGAGEGDLERFPYSLQIEIHSTFGTIIFSYGIPGILLFASFIASLVRGLGWSHRMILAALFLYSLTHNGLRFPFFWFTLGTLIAEAVHLKADQRG